MKILRSIIKDVRVVRRCRHRRDSLKAINEIAGRIAIKRLRADPIILLLSSLQIHHAVLSLARSVDDVWIAWIRHDWSSLAPWTRTPIIAVVWIGLAGSDDRGVVLLGAV